MSTHAYTETLRAKLLQVFIELCSHEDPEFLALHAYQMAEVSIRVRMAETGPDESVLRETKEAAVALLDALERKLGSSVFMSVYGKVQQALQRRRLNRKTAATAEAVFNPRAHALRKV